MSWGTAPPAMLRKNTHQILAFAAGARSRLPECGQVAHPYKLDSGFCAQTVIIWNYVCVVWFAERPVGIYIGLAHCEVKIRTEDFHADLEEA